MDGLGGTASIVRGMNWHQDGGRGVRKSVSGGEQADCAFLGEGEANGVPEWKGENELRTATLRRGGICERAARTDD